MTFLSGITVRQSKSDRENHLSAEMRKPNFLIIGAPKCATTSLAAYVAQHPDVYIPKDKECHFFDKEEKYRLGEQYYLKKFFSRVSTEKAVGEATPSYLRMHDIVIPRLLLFSEPDRLKFIVILRDPVERAWSHYLHNRRLMREPLSFREALRMEQTRLRKNPEAWFGYFSSGLYGQQLAVWLRHYSRSRFLVIKQRGLAKDPAYTLKRCFEFLGVDDRSRSVCLQRYNAAAVARSKVLMRLLTSEGSAGKLLKRAFPTTPSFVRKIRRWNTRSARAGELPAFPQDLERMLRKRYVEDIEKLEAHTGISFAEWKDFEQE